MTQAVRTALAERLQRERRRQGRKGRDLADELDALAKEFTGFPVIDDRTPDEIVGYDENGMW